MFRIFYAEKDATLYEPAPNINTGVDEVLEVGKRLSTDGETLQKSRSVVKFDMSEIADTLAKYNVSLENCKFVLQLYTTHAKNLPAEYTIDANVVGQEWINGTGFENDSPITTDGVSWNYPLSGSNWISGSQDIQINGSSLYVTGSGEGGSWLYQSGSGIFNTSSFNSSYFFQPGLDESESFSYRPTDINMDVTEAVQLWISGSGGKTIENNGFLLKFSEADEADNNKQGYIRFFSRETHTIYVPKLTMYWDNSEYDNTLTEIDLESYTMYTKLKAEYRDTDIVKVRVYGRDKYPRKSPLNLYPMQTVKRLPETTYYSIRDAATDEVIIPFDNIYNKVSCDSTSNFIYLDMNGFMPERYYRLEFKIVDGFTEQRIDDEYYFKVIR
jgi:hypothetical protein